MISRRVFLAGAASAAAAGAANAASPTRFNFRPIIPTVPSSPPAAPAAPDTDAETDAPNRRREKFDAGIIDTHTHFYDPTRPGGVPWPPASDAFLHRPVLPSEYEFLARPLGISSTVVVEASSWVTDNRWVLDLATESPFLIGLVGHLKPGKPGFAEQLEREIKDRRFRGIRIGTWDGPPAFENPDFLKDCALLEKRGLTVDLLIGPDQLSLVTQMAERFPNLRIVIDHCANVKIDGKLPDTKWRRGIILAAKNRRVSMKFSGYTEGTGRTDGTAPQDLAYYRPTFDFVYDNFGPDRLIFGSNWPVSARFAPLETVVAIARQYFESRGMVAEGFRKNAIATYKLKRA